MYLTLCISSCIALASKLGADIFTFCFRIFWSWWLTTLLYKWQTPSLWTKSVIPFAIQSKRPRAKLPSGLSPDLNSWWTGQQQWPMNKRDHFDHMLLRPLALPYTIGWDHLEYPARIHSSFVQIVRLSMYAQWCGLATVTNAFFFGLNYHQPCL